QFNDSADLAKYPRTIESDTKILVYAGCDVLYLPTGADVYNGEVKVTEKFNFYGLDTILEGASRPGHFAGVAQVVKLLLDITEPHKIFLGQKDFQQWLIIQRMVQMLKMPVAVVRCPIYREENGLAMSSRNIRLSEQARKDASVIFQTLQWAAAQLPFMPAQKIEREAVNRINGVRNFITDYFNILHASDLTPVVRYDSAKETVIVTSVLVEGVRLLDNLLIEAF
ncbi:MAG: pantoate--beta-alanine ligase, partial [Chitinophagales bacterium]